MNKYEQTLGRFNRPTPEQIKNTLMTSLNDTDPMPFGKHKGIKMQDVPASYLHYLWQNGLKDDMQSVVADYIRRNIDALRKEYKDGIWS